MTRFGPHMKLRQITEDIKGSHQVIRKSAKALGNLIRFAYDNLDPHKSRELASLNAFLQKPSPRGWENTKWIIDSLTRKVINNDKLVDQAKQWNELKGLTSPIVSASVYDVEPRDTRGTPIGDISLSRNLRDKLKEALGPEGYVSALADMGEVNDHKIKELLKSTAKSGKALNKAVKIDMPTASRKRTIKRF